MAVGVPEYTGLGAGGVLPKFSGEKLAESQEKMFQTVLEAGKFKYTEKKKEEAEFLKNIYVKPEFMISAKARTEMAKAYKAHSDKWSQILKNDVKTEGNFSFDHQIQLQNETAALKMAQDEYLQNMGRWKVINDWMVQDKGVNGDTDAWMQETKKLYDTGRIDMTTPPLKSYDFASYLAGESKKITDKYPVKPTTIGGRIWSGTVNIQGEDAITDFIKTNALKDPRAVQGLAKEFISLPNETKRIYLEDLNRDQILDDKDIDQNAIIRWAVQNPRFREAAITPLGTWTNVPRPRSTTEKFDYSNINAQNNLNNKYDILPNQTFEKVTVKSFLNFSPDETSAKTQPIQKYIDLATGKEETLNKAATFKVVGYSPDEDMIIVNLITQVPMTGKEDVYLPANKQIGLKGVFYDDFLRKKFGIDRQSLMREHGYIPSLIKRPEGSGLTWQ